ncbi:MAG TPA: hypothetical protein DDX81_12075 [Desulfofustis sp.]|nr:hypothetical protein [Desulfofustis sp.]
MGETRYFRAGWVIDGTGAAPRRDVLMTVTDGVFAGFADFSEEDRLPEGLLTDLSYAMILPLLVDSHTHLGMSGTIDRAAREQQLGNDYQARKKIVGANLRNYFGHGVGAVRDAGDRQNAVLRYCREVAQDQRPPVIVKAVGRAIHAPDRYGALIGASLSDDPRKSAETELDGGADCLKIVNSGLNSLREYGKTTAPQFSPEQLKAMVNAAKSRGAPVMVHANGEEPVRRAIEAGCSSIEHGFFMGRDNIELMAERGIYWVPTLFTMHAMRVYFEGLGGQADRSVIERTLDSQFTQVAHARRCGVRIACGSDAGGYGVLHGEAVVEELKLLKMAGLKISEAICSATEHGARLLGVDHELGCLAVGKPAHFLVARGTIGQLPRKIRFLDAIYHNGAPSPLYRKEPEYDFSA